MKMYCTGICGFLGSNLANKLYGTTGYLLRGCDDLSFGYRKNLRKEIIWEKEDFYDLEASYLNQFDILIHCATSNLFYAHEHPIGTVINNAYHTIELFERYQGKIINISTASVYGQATVIPTPEDAEIKVSNAYDVSKRMVELYLHKRGNFTTLRPSNIYGINQRADIPQYCGVVGKMCSEALNGQSINLIGDGTQTRDFTYVEDVVGAIIQAIHRPAFETEINIATGIETSIRTVEKMIWKSLNKVEKYSRAEQRSQDTISRRCLDVSKAEKLLGWKPTTSLEVGLRKTLAWLPVNIFS